MEADCQSTKAFSVECTKERQEGSRYSSTHLSPLSSYSRKIMYGNTEGSPSQFGGNLPASFCNIKIEILNNQPTHQRGTKRHLDDSSLDESYTTPLKKHFALSSSSPYQPSVWDSCGPLAGKGQAPKSPAKPQKTPQRLTMIRKAGRGVRVEHRTPVPCPAPVRGGHSAVPSPDEADAKTGFGSTGEAQTLPCPKSPSAPQDCRSADFDISQAFNLNTDNILSLSPIDSNSDSDNSKGIEAFIDSCQSFYENSINHPTGDTQEATGGREEEEEEEEGRESRKEVVSIDEGYFSRSYRKALRKTSEGVLHGDGTSDLSLLQPSCVSTPAPPARALPSCEQVATVGGAFRGPAPADEPVVCRNLLSYLDDAPGSLASAGWQPRPESTGALRAAEGREEQEGNSKVLLPVQMRSVVVVPLKRAGGSDTRTQSGLKRIKRPVVYDREADWQREKRLYVDTVSNHMADGATSGGVLTELVNLMRTVAGQGVGDCKKPWQHPSDLTRRTYQGRAGKPKLSLDEWQQQNSRSYCRFANVPIIFQRSPVL